MTGRHAGASLYCRPASALSAESEQAGTATPRKGELFNRSRNCVLEAKCGRGTHQCRPNSATAVHVSFSGWPTMLATLGPNQDGPILLASAC
jgi:hypothetical protein